MKPEFRVLWIIKTIYILRRRGQETAAAICGKKSGHRLAYFRYLSLSMPQWEKISIWLCYDRGARHINHPQIKMATRVAPIPLDLIASRCIPNESSVLKGNQINNRWTVRRRETPEYNYVGFIWTKCASRSTKSVLNLWIFTGARRILPKVRRTRSE